MFDDWHIGEACDNILISQPVCQELLGRLKEGNVLLAVAALGCSTVLGQGALGRRGEEGLNFVDHKRRVAVEIPSRSETSLGLSIVSFPQ